MKAPLIGITLDYETAQTYAAYPWYALRENYITAVEQAGGIPFLLPYVSSQISKYLEVIDGLLIPGGDSDINPCFYGVNERHKRVVTKDNRAQFELKLTEAALKKDLPILGICGGQQVLNVVLGGTLIQHIPDYSSDCLIHEQTQPKHQPTHEIDVVEGTLLHRILKEKTIRVNSTHHQAVEKLGRNVQVNAQASDNIIEAIEVSGQRFCLGVQWHPEYLSTRYDHAIFKAFIQAMIP
jgi:putative glutamine amidotransferase